MSVFLIFIIPLSVSIGLSVIFIRKVIKKDTRLILYGISFVLALLFSIAFTVCDYVQHDFVSLAESQIAVLEKKANELYPDILDKPIETEALKNVLKEIATENIPSYDFAGIIKRNIEKQVNHTIDILQHLENDGCITIKGALQILSEDVSKAIAKPLQIVKKVLISVFIISLLILILITHYSKNQKMKNTGVVFSEESDKTEIGMKF